MKNFFDGMNLEKKDGLVYCRFYNYISGEHTNTQKIEFIAVLTSVEMEKSLTQFINEKNLKD